MLDVEVVERKGLGHPDTIAELIADEFIRRYAVYALTYLDVVPNVSVDKTTIVGALMRLNYGKMVVERHAEVLLIGKITRSVGDVTFPLVELLRETVTHVLTYVGLAELLPFLTLTIRNNNRSTNDSERELYRPVDAASVRTTDPATWRAADTVTVCVDSGLTPLERLVITLERELTGQFTSLCSAVGTDVKVHAVRRHHDVDVTFCVPVRATAVTSRAEYRSVVSAAREHAATVLTRFQPEFRCQLRVNTKDDDERAFLVAFASALDRGDSGAVGRGNGPLGIRSLTRWAGTDARAGKNPFNHPARLYSELTSELDASSPAHVVLTAENGAPLARPTFVLATTSEAYDAAIRFITDLDVKLPKLALTNALRDPLATFTGRSDDE